MMSQSKTSLVHDGDMTPVYVDLSVSIFLGTIYAIIGTLKVEVTHAHCSHSLLMTPHIHSKW